MLPHRRGYGKSHLGHHFRDPEREVSDTHGRFLYPSPEIISSWSSIEVVITRRTRNPLAFRGPWVRIPPAPPSKKLFAFFGKELFAWKDLPSGVFPTYAPSPCLMPLLLRRAISSGKRTTSSYSIVSQHQLMIALSGSVKSSQPFSFPTWFMTHDPLRKKSH